MTGEMELSVRTEGADESMELSARTEGSEKMGRNVATSGDTSGDADSCDAAWSGWWK